MRDYLSLLPNEWEDKADGIQKVVIIEDMLKHGTLFFEMELGETSQLMYKATEREIMESILRKGDAPMLIWSKELGRTPGVFGFNENGQKLIMLFDPTTLSDGFDKVFLSTLNSIGGENMAKICPKTGGYVLYLDCMECEDKSECKGGK